MLVLMIVISFFLPEWLTVYSDRDTKGRITLEPVTPPPIDAKKHSLLNSLNLLTADPHAVEKVALEFGVNFDAATAKAHFMAEADNLSTLDLFPSIGRESDIVFQIDVALYTKHEDPLVNAVIWNIAFLSDRYSGNVYLDDATGKAILFRVFSPEPEPVRKNGITMIRTWSVYLGLDAADIRQSTTDSSVREDDGTKITNRSYQVYRFNLASQNQSAPAALYIFSNGYGFGDVASWTFRQDRTAIEIKGNDK